jgi:hypothetical protein
MVRVHEADEQVVEDPGEFEEETLVKLEDDVQGDPAVPVQYCHENVGLQEPLHTPVASALKVTEFPVHD